MIVEVKGVRVTPVRKATMPASIRMFVSDGARLSQPERVAPMLAPALRAGAKIPPAAPVVKDNNGPAMRRSGMYQLLYLSFEKREFIISSLPEPSVLSLMKKARAAMISAQAVT